MFENTKRITIFTGHYGSGKTEVAINYTIELAETKKKVAIVDLDVVNPYFRSREVKDQLEAKGIKVVSPQGTLHHADLPAISPEILGVLQNEEFYVVFDVGGDDVGATALGRFKNSLPEGAYDMFFVVNSFRPFTSEPTKIRDVLSEVEIASRLKVTGLVSNGNLSYETDSEVILEGYHVTKAASESLKLPLVFVGVRDEIYEKESERLSSLIEEPLLKVKLFLLPSWLESPINTDPKSKFKPI